MTLISRLFFVYVILSFCISSFSSSTPYFDELKHNFEHPDHAQWGEVPLWWWEGAKMTKERVTWQLETLAAKGVKAVCPIQRSPGRCDPQSFSPEWWEMFEYTHQECKRLGITLWAYDQVGYGYYGWLEKAAAKTQDNQTHKISILTIDSDKNDMVRMEIPEGKMVGARAYPLHGSVVRDDESTDVSNHINDQLFEWKAEGDNWRVVILVAVPYQSFYLSDETADTFIDMFYGEIENRLGKDAMGKSFSGIFQDEHPPTPRDIYTDHLAENFKQKYGYDIARAIPALHFDVGKLTPKYRMDYFDAYLSIVESTYWRKVYDWTNERGLLTSYDNWGRGNIHRQSAGYIDYYRTQRWFSAPGYDDAGQGTVEQRNYYDTKIASSIANLYKRPRVWNEAFHSSGWGRTTDQTISWLSTGLAWGANLYDEHGLYYSTNASTWEHAAPDPHWRQPYWEYYQTLSDWVARTSYLMSQGYHVADVAVHYPVTSLLAGEPPNSTAPNYNFYMTLSRSIYDDGIDNNIADDDSFINGKIQDGKLFMGENGYQALVFGPETTVRLSVLQKAFGLIQAGGTVLFYERIPSGSVEGGRNDPKLASLLSEMVGISNTADADGKVIDKKIPSGGYCAFIPSNYETIPAILSNHIIRDFISVNRTVNINHRHIDDTHVYLVQNRKPEPLLLKAKCRVEAVPELWDSFTGTVKPIGRFERNDGYTEIEHLIEGNAVHFIVFRPGEEKTGSNPLHLANKIEKPLSNDWEFSTIATRDNAWGEMRWEPSNEKIGPEVRQFLYKEELEQDGTKLGWHKPDYDDSDWETQLYSTGPYWLYVDQIPAEMEITSEYFESLKTLKPFATLKRQGKSPLEWMPLSFSKTISLNRAAPWGGHSGYPDGHIDKNFINMTEAGRKLLFTRIHSPKQQDLGLRVELRNSPPRLWVNGQEQPLEDTVGYLPLNKGENTVLLDLPNGGKGMLYVQKQPPSATSIKDAGREIVTPNVHDASWIWYGDTSSCFLRKTFSLDEIPEQARVTVTAFSGFRLFINGQKIEEEIGPWANWEKPETFSITSYLQKGRNVIAAWAQMHMGQHVNKGSDDFIKRGFLLSLKTSNQNGDEFSLSSDASWKGSTTETTGWETLNHDDSQWDSIKDLGMFGVDPWGTTLLENMKPLAVPRRPLSVELTSPYLECFKETPDIVYEVKPKNEKRIGWYRFIVPPGLNKLILNTKAKAEVWLDGVAAAVKDGYALIENPPSAMSQVVIRLQLNSGEYGGAAFTKPIGLDLKGGKIQTGEWKNYALPDYSGIGVYEQEIVVSKEESLNQFELDLGNVLVAAEVLVNGNSAGVCLARPFSFDLTKWIHEGNNTIEIRVANTIAPHYGTLTTHRGPTASGLMGPVRLYMREPSKG